MTWEPKQGEEVYFRNICNDKIKAEFVATYNGVYVIKRSGDIFCTPAIEQIKPEPEITVGSVWEKDGVLWVATYEQDNGYFCLFSPHKNETYRYADSVLIKEFKPRPDKIGMAPCVVKSVLIAEFSHYISDGIFASADDARAAFRNGNFVSWPANNSMWVIVDK